MWSVSNKTAYAAAGGWIRDLDGTEVWVVAVKATYDVLPGGELRIAADQVPVHRAAVPHEGLESLLSDSDLVPRHPATDVLLVGCAHAQTEVPVAELDVAWCVGQVKRSARVIGPRRAGRGMLGAVGNWLAGPTGPEPFTRMPLTWERAQAHPDLNPVGCGRGSTSGHFDLPNVEPLRGDGAAPVGFGPIHSHWRPRRDHAGSYDDRWLECRSPLLPEDLDPRHWQSAVAEQQVTPYLRGGERVGLLNLTPAGFAADGRVSFTLPRLSLSLETRFYDGSVERSRSVIHAVVLDTHERPRVSVVHHMALPCHPKVNLLDRTIVREMRRPLDIPARPEEASGPISVFDEAEGSHLENPGDMTRGDA